MHNAAQQASVCHIGWMFLLFVGFNYNPAEMPRREWGVMPAVPEEGPEGCGGEDGRGARGLLRERLMSFCPPEEKKNKHDQSVLESLDHFSFHDIVSLDPQ